MRNFETKVKINNDYVTMSADDCYYSFSHIFFLLIRHYALTSKRQMTVLVINFNFLLSVLEDILHFGKFGNIIYVN